MMKHCRYLILCILVLSLLLAVPGMAATSGYTADKSTDSTLYAGTLVRNSAGVYTAEMTTGVVNGSYYSVIVTTSDSPSDISTSSLLYIDIQEAASGKVSFTIRPKTSEAANVYVGGVFSNGAVSPVLVGRILEAKTEAPVITAAAVSGKVTVSWAAVDGATKYNVYRRTYNGSTWSAWGSPVTVTSAGYEDTSVTAGTKYQYRCAAYGAGGWSSYSNSVTVTVPMDKPAAPKFTAAAAAGKVTVSWTAVTGAEKYSVCRRTYSGSTWSTWETLATVTTPGYVDTAVTAGTKYQYRGAAWNSGGWSSYSSSVTVTVPAAAPKPDAPVISLTVTPDKVTVKWAAVAGATQYRVYRRTYNGSTWGSWGTPVTVTTNSYVDTDVSVGNKYQYRCAAYGAGGWSSYSNSPTATVVEKPAAPVISVTATAGKNTVKWAAVPNATKYSVYRRTYNGSSWSAWVTVKTVYGTNYADTNVVSGTKYQYRVATCNSGVWSSYSNSVAVVAK